MQRSKPRKIVHTRAHITKKEKGEKDKCSIFDRKDIKGGVYSSLDLQKGFKMLRLIRETNQYCNGDVGINE